MQNINIHQNRPKRSVQSLIQDSAIDNQDNVINFEIIQIKKAYNQTYKSFNTKVQQLQTQLAKYKQKCKKLEQANVKIAQKCQNFEQKQEQYNQIKTHSQKMKRKVLYVEGKYQKLMENRALVCDGYDKQEQVAYDKWKITGNTSDSKNNKVDRNEVYRQISQLINTKIKLFTKDLKQYSMTKEVQLKIEAFLQDLYYINPLSAGGKLIFKESGDRQIGKISRKQTQKIVISEQQAWKQLEKSIQKLKTSNENTHDQMTTPKRQNLFNQESLNKINKRSRSPLIVNNDSESNWKKQAGYHPLSKNKPRIFGEN